MALRPVETPCATEDALPAILAQLEEDIVFGYLLPRERLVEDNLMKRFQAKRHVVRHALAELQRMGLVERSPNKGAAVRDLSPTDAEQLYAVREILETAAASQIELGNPAVIAALSAIQERHDAAIAAADIKAAFRINIEFHRKFFAACGNPHLAGAIEHYGQQTHGIRSLSITRTEYLRSAGEEHWAMIECLRRGDRARLVGLCRTHISHSKVAYIEAYRARLPAGAVA